MRVPGPLPSPPAGDRDKPLPGLAGPAEPSSFAERGRSGRQLASCDAVTDSSRVQVLLTRSTEVFLPLHRGHGYTKPLDRSWRIIGNQPLPPREADGSAKAGLGASTAMNSGWDKMGSRRTTDSGWHSIPLHDDSTSASQLAKDVWDFVLVDVVVPSNFAHLYDTPGPRKDPEVLAPGAWLKRARSPTCRPGSTTPRYRLTSKLLLTHRTDAAADLPREPCSRRVPERSLPSHTTLLHLRLVESFPRWLCLRDSCGHHDRHGGLISPVLDVPRNIHGVWQIHQTTRPIAKHRMQLRTVEHPLGEAAIMDREPRAVHTQPRRSPMHVNGILDGQHVAERHVLPRCCKPSLIRGSAAPRPSCPFDEKCCSSAGPSVEFIPARKAHLDD
ncbi:hypothetical protein B0T11DRAFT_136878 [Plectosphaerella cucumerina]|uniref:Uncharacterized protein n=1 Tax=Plectosphaerella cucumerina TaxID=40658 RepID=A0A8K0T491_9PEZI|nr:hypothetical protein B0T11DRAFT_136878 [Plectosphaerella cucumerina]